MHREWIKVFIAAFFEVFWVIGLKHSSDLWEWLGTAVMIYLSFHLMIMAGRKLPAGTVYAIFVGMGTCGTIIAEIIFFGEPFNLTKVLFILLLLTGILGLKLVTKEDETDKDYKSWKGAKS